MEIYFPEIDEAKILEIESYNVIKKRNIEILEAINEGGNVEEIESKWQKNIYENYKPISFSINDSQEIRYIKMSRVLLMELDKQRAKTLLDYLVLRENGNNNR